LAGLFGNLEPNRSPCLFLPDRRSIDWVAIRRHVIDADGNDIAATELAIDGQIEERQISYLTLDL